MYIHSLPLARFRIHRSFQLLRVFVVPNNYGDHFRVATPESDI